MVRKRWFGLVKIVTILDEDNETVWGHIVSGWIGTPMRLLNLDGYMKG